MNKIEENNINKSNINTNINSSSNPLEKNEISVYDQKQNIQLIEKFDNLKEKVINSNDNNINSDDHILNSEKNLINNNNKNSSKEVFNLIKNNFNQIFIPTISSNEQQEELKKHIVKMQELKFILISRNITFRQEFDYFPFNIETEILYKGIKDKEYKNYHLSLFKNQLTLYKKKKTSKNDNNNLINNSQTSNENMNKNNIFYEKYNNEDKKNIYIINNNKKNTKSKSKEDNFLNHQNFLKKLYDIYHPILHLNFDLVSCNISVNKNDFKFYIRVLSLKNFTFKFQLKNKDIKLFNIITNKILISIKNSRGYFNNLFEVSLRKDFYSQYFMKLGEFEYYAKTGDILLFRGFECSAKLQRFYTKSIYDHVAILFRKNGILYVYEATAKDGCKSRPWRKFINYLWFLLYDKMVYRKLLINVDDDEEKKKIKMNIENKFDIFLKETDKVKKYSLKFCSIMCGSEPTESQKNNEWKKKKGFSCSSLIAAAYLTMNIIKYDKNVNEILPGNFSYDQQIELNQPFELGPEIIIDFSN